MKYIPKPISKFPALFACLKADEFIKHVLKTSFK